MIILETLHSLAIMTIQFIAYNYSEYDDCIDAFNVIANGE